MLTQATYAVTLVTSELQGYLNWLAFRAKLPIIIVIVIIIITIIMTILIVLMIIIMIIIAKKL